MPSYRLVRDQAQLAKRGEAAHLYLRTFEIQNYRCFRQRQTISFLGADDLPARWTIILGENGAGKSTLLECIAANFPITAGYIQEAEREADSNEGTPSAESTDIELRAEYPDDNAYWRKLADSDFRASSEFHVGDLDRKTSRRIRSSTATRTSDDKRSLDEVFKEMATANNTYSAVMFGGNSQPNIVLQNVSDTRPLKGNAPYYSLVAAYGAQRIISSGEQRLVDGARDATSSIFNPWTTLRSAEEWLLKIDYAARASKSRNDNSLAISKVVSSLVQLLPDVESIEIRRNDDLRIPSVIFKTRFGDLTVDKLSLGYQSTIAWLVDLASRMMDHYPDSADFMSEPVVALIDEIDLHMHPRWQREIMVRLSAAFPKAQFIATSHSPLVVQAAPNVNAIILEAEGQAAVVRSGPNEVRSWRLDQILTSDLFGLKSARSPEIEILLEEKRKIATKPKLSARDAARLKELEAQLEDLQYFDRAEDNHALDIIRRAAARLKDQS